MGVTEWLNTVRPMGCNGAYLTQTTHGCDTAVYLCQTHGVLQRKFYAQQPMGVTERLNIVRPMGCSGTFIQVQTLSEFTFCEMLDIL